MIKLLSHIFFLVLVLLLGCDKRQKTTPSTHEDPAKEFTDSFAIKNLKFGTSRQMVIKEISSEFIENKITEPAFDQIITELESSMVIDSHRFKAYYYFSPANTLYKLVLVKKIPLDMRKYPNDGFHDSYHVLYTLFKNDYGKGEVVRSKLKHDKLYWNLENKSILLEKFLFEGEGNIECTLVDKKIYLQFDKYILKHRARTHYKERVQQHSYTGI